MPKLWRPALYEKDSDPHKRRYWHALLEYVKKLPDAEKEMPIYVERNGKLVLRREP